MQRTVYIVSLGCAKNLVDSEVILGSLVQAGWKIVEDASSAQILLINTCGFIQSAVEEAVDEILQLVKVKTEFPDKKLVVVGCLVQRYKDQLLPELPEVDLFIGTEGGKDMAGYFEALLRGRPSVRIDLPSPHLPDSTHSRILTTPHFRSFLKVTEGCNNRCSYCMIPAIRGRLRSRGMADLVREALFLQDKGVKELSLIAQDLTAFGTDQDKKENLRSLLELLLAATTIPWVRLMYLYPSGVDDDLLDIMVDEPRIVPYLDIPIQHASTPILAAMNRRYSREDLCSLVGKIRSRLPAIALRTTLLVGFPGEKEADVLLLEQFLREMRFDHVGIFAYSNEEGCASEYFPEQCSEQEKDARRQHLLNVQADISAQVQQKYIGRVEPVLIEGLSSETELLLEGRTRFQAPDVDGCVYIVDGVANPGDIVQVHITEAHVYDLVGEIVATGTEG
ncbi:30S ribosomal protein S12 methylthiotransferase RimO [Desulfoprunum benzoelyticum]|uniref:Ribosomal protein uS12 methylthiotransferase RimO n=1 Tax=Desulfoprunum benzoelyticum TaxID=1506996 RepID=A0A840UZN5_9BACT|nr:30S ribosomal protein S12 methylthiotransferase RimO [Desulfoprunum benzoelyticum]MBB5346919.1 ribosomal protein S12 methylthiotransferase [Desulfoprunum benzoelyticum]MBM9529419.1 30S ribosomal protein S12 methylthiotransferase RimO [Desulfoprunum benzoelyticum]